MKKNYILSFLLVLCLLFSLTGCITVTVNKGDDVEKIETVPADNKENVKTEVKEEVKTETKQEVKTVEPIEVKSSKQHVNEKFDLKFNIPDEMEVATKSELDEVSKSTGQLEYEFQGSIMSANDFQLIQIATDTNAQYLLLDDDALVDGIKEGFLSSAAYTPLGDGKLKIGNKEFNYFDMYLSSSGVTIRSKALIRRQDNSIILIMLMGLNEDSINKLINQFE